MASTRTPDEAWFTQPHPYRSLVDAIRKDVAANPRDPRAHVLLTMFRLARAVTTSEHTPRLLRLVVAVVYRVLSESLWSVELRPKTRVGESLAIHHGFGLVVNDHSVIGDRVTLRHGVTIGHAHAGGGCPVIEDDVEIGAGATVIGPIVIGRGAVIGAGAVVTRDVGPGDIVVGNPGRVVGPPRGTQTHER